MKVIPKQLLALAFLCPFLCWGDVTNSPAEATTNIEDVQAALRKVQARLHFQTGTIKLKGDVATLEVTNGYRFLGPDDTKFVIENLWGNPPGSKPLGMIVPPGSELAGSNSWAIVVTYQNDGYVKDSDADKINYTELLTKMQKSTAEDSKDHVKQGYASIDLVGWAEPPHYDSTTHKMYWAQDLKFGGEDQDTLNYNIRVLGRKGILILNAVATVPQLPEIREQAPAIIKMAEFTSGNRYEDFNGHTDKVAAYGLAALVAGGVAAKLGGFKLLLAGILAAKKFIIIGAAAIAGYFRRLFGRKRGPSNLPPPSGPAPTV